MPIKHALWTVGANPTPLRTSQLASEQLLEDMIEKNLSILSENWMLIGRQEITPFGGRTDLLAIDPNGDLVLIELKKQPNGSMFSSQFRYSGIWGQLLKLALRISSNHAASRSWPSRTALKSRPTSVSAPMRDDR